jgi:hypothetical protein
MPRHEFVDWEEKKKKLEGIAKEESMRASERRAQCQSEVW